MILARSVLRLHFSRVLPFYRNFELHPFFSMAVLLEVSYPFTFFVFPSL